MKKVFECQVCGSTKSRLVIDMGLTPLVNTLPPIDLDPPVDCVYDLALIQCEACTLVQLRFAPDMESVFPESYPYLSGLTTPLVRNFQNQALDVVKFLKEKFEDMVDGINDKYESMMHDAKSFASKGRLKDHVNETDHVSV